MKDLKNISDKDLNKELSQKRESLRLFRFGVAGSKSKDIRKGRNTRKDIAKILTEKNSRS